MNIDPLIEVQGAKRISLQKAATSVGKFTSIVCNDNAVSILNKQQRLSKPSEHVSEKLKVLVASMNEEMDAFTAASTDAAKSTSNNVVNSSTPTSKSRNNRNEVAASSSANKRKLIADTDTNTDTDTDTKSNNAADASKAKVAKSPKSSKKPKSKSKIK